MNAVAGLTAEAFEPELRSQSRGYLHLLEEACELADPVYGLRWYGERYREVATDPSWFVQSLVANAAVEGEGAAKLWVLAGRCRVPGISDQLRRHAVDEARHSQYYIRLLEAIFPEAISASDRPELAALTPQLTPTDVPPTGPAIIQDDLFDDLVQINIGEIRTRIHQLLLQPVALAYCSPDNRSAVERLMRRLVRDEGRHIAYTGDLIARAWETGNARQIRHLMVERMEEFNTITLSEVGVDTFDGG